MPDSYDIRYSAKMSYTSYLPFKVPSEKGFGCFEIFIDCSG